MAKNKKIGKKIVFILDVEPYKQQCIIVCNGTFNDAYKIFKKNLKNKLAKETIAHIDEHKKEYFEKTTGKGYLYTQLPHGFVMTFNHSDSWIDTVGTISHECTHLTHYVLQRAGLELCKESEEAFTYLQEDLLEKILRKIY